MAPPAATPSTTARPSALRTWALTALAMLAFAANSLLCRLALQHQSIDPASFSSVRLASGAAMLAVLLRLQAGPAVARAGDWRAAAMLFGYVAFFSFAYLSLGAGTGALILFGAVQVTMFSAGLGAGERFRPLAWCGLALAVGGLVWLVSPGLSAPAPLGAALMAAAGLCWGLYSLRGRGVAHPLAATGGNFLRALPMALALSLLTLPQAGLGAEGVALAVTSGAFTSGVGYVVWYAALRGLTALRAATVQLSVPPLAALGGALLLGEAVTPRLLGASVLILGGVVMALTSRAHASGR